MDSFKILNSIEEPLDQAGENLKKIEKNEKILKSKDMEDCVKKLRERWNWMKETIGIAQSGSFLTINSLRDDAKNFQSNVEIIKNETEKTNIDQSSKMLVESLASNSQEILNLVKE
jgi:hypothetical protein